MNRNAHAHRHPNIPPWEIPGAKRPTKPGTCSFGQHWLPFTSMDEGVVVRPSLIMLVSETLQQPLVHSCSPDPLDLEGQTEWLKNACREVGHPPELLVHDPHLLAAVRFRLPGTRVRLSQEMTQLRRWQTMLAPPEEEFHPWCLRDKMGDAAALDAWVAQLEFLQAEPWKRLNSSMILEFTSGRSRRAVVVTGCDGGNERGLYLFSDPQAVARGACYPLGTCGPGDALLHHHRDLNLTSQHHISLPVIPRTALDNLYFKPHRQSPLRRKFPMFQSENPTLLARRVHDFTWLLKRLPEFSVGLTPIREGDYSLKLSGLRAQLAPNGLPEWLDRLRRMPGPGRTEFC